MDTCATCKKDASDGNSCCPQHTSLVKCSRFVNAEFCRSSQKWCKSCESFRIISTVEYPADCPTNLAHVRRGYWRIRQNSTTIIKCAQKDICLGGNVTTPSSRQCARGHKGVVCQVCEDGFSTQGRRCTECKSAGATISFVVAVLIILLFILACTFVMGGFSFAKENYDAWKMRSDMDDTKKRILMLRKYSYQNSDEEGNAVGSESPRDTIRETDEPNAGENTESAEEFQWLQRMQTAERKMISEWGYMEAAKIIQRKVKIVVSFYQVVTLIPSYYEIYFPASFTDFLVTFNFVNLEPSELVPIHCGIRMSYYAYYLVKMLIPPLVLVVAFVLIQLKPGKGNIIWNATIIFIFLLYPSYCGTCGESFRCLSVDKRRDETYLKADLRVKCTPNRLHETFTHIDILFIALYPIGIPLGLLLLMWPHREDLINRPMETQLPNHLEHLNFLCIQYESTTWYWEVVECLRKYMMVGFSVALFQGYPSSQILMATIVSILYNMYFLYYAPYISDLDDVLAYSSHVTLLFFFLISIYLRFNVLTKDFAALANIQSREVLGIDYAFTVIFVLIISIFFAGIAFAYLELQSLKEKGTLRDHTYISGDGVFVEKHGITDGGPGEVKKATREIKWITDITYIVELANGEKLTMTHAQNVLRPLEQDEEPTGGQIIVVDGDGCVDETAPRTTDQEVIELACDVGECQITGEETPRLERLEMTTEIMEKATTENEKHTNPQRL